MSETSDKFDSLTKEQQLELKRAGRKFVLKMLLSGVNTGGLIFFSNLVLILANLTFFQSTPFLFVSVMLVDIYLFHRMSTINRETIKSFEEQAKKILDNK